MNPAPLRAMADGTVMARVVGRQPPDILALHGWGRDGSDFTEVLDGMAAIVPDLPGFGYSPPPNQVWGAQEYARCLVAVLEQMHTPAVVVGHSFGGRIAVCLAVQRPELVRGLVLTGAPLVRGKPSAAPPLLYRMIRWAHRRGLVSDARLEATRRRFGSEDYRAARGLMRQILVKVVNESYEQQLDGLSVPVELIWGAEDPQVPADRAQAAFERLEAAGCPVRLQIIPAEGHDLPLSRPQILRDAIEYMQKETNR